MIFRWVMGERIFFIVTLFRERFAKVIAVGNLRDITNRR